MPLTGRSCAAQIGIRDKSSLESTSRADYFSPFDQFSALQDEIAQTLIVDADCEILSCCDRTQHMLATFGHSSSISLAVLSF
jgi:hypothetical protein